MKSKILEDTDCFSLERKLNDFFEGKSFYLNKINQPPKILHVSYSHDRDLRGIYPNIYSVLIVYDE